MKQIFTQHVDQKDISPQGIKNAIKVYIDKFDPDRIYLLENEVRPYLDLTDKQLNAIVLDYKQNRYTIFEKLNQTIQSAILRGRTMRNEIKKNPSALFNVTLVLAKQEGSDVKRAFPKDNEALVNSIKYNSIRYIRGGKQRFGNAVVNAHIHETLQMFEEALQERENKYLYRNAQGVSLSYPEQENLFVMRVLKSIASSLDSHTNFYDEAEALDLKMRLQKEFKGVGIIFQQAMDGTIMVSDISDGGPAAKSGLVHIGDTVLEVNGTAVEGLSFETVMEIVRISKGSALSENIQFTFKRKSGNEIAKIDLIKKEIPIKGERAEAGYKKIDGGVIGLITMKSFYQNANGITSEGDIQAAIKKINEMGTMRGLILDLRENSGGFLNQAVKVAGLFISNGVVVVSKYFNGEEHHYRDLDGKISYNGPLVILTSRATASAAEIVAQALQDYGVAIVVGDETTYGKGTIQNQNITASGEKSGSSLFKVTVGKYYTVSGKTPQLKGVQADIIVPGIFNFEHLGEQFLEFTVKNDSIESTFTDGLEDVNPELMPWYERYYLPTVQNKTQLWQQSLPLLRSQSAKRLLVNRQYQTFLTQARSGHPSNFFTTDTKGAPRAVDFQLDEAVNIVQDMINLKKTDPKQDLSQDLSKTIAEQKNTKNFVAEKKTILYD